MTRVTPKTLESTAGLMLQQDAAKLISKDDAWRIAVKFAKLSERMRNSFCSIVAKASSV